MASPLLVAKSGKTVRPPAPAGRDGLITVANGPGRVLGSILGKRR